MQEFLCVFLSLKTLSLTPPPLKKFLDRTPRKGTVHTLAPHDRKKLRQQTFPNCLLNENSHRESNYMGYLFPVLSPPADLIVSPRMAFRAWQITEKWNSVISFTHLKLQIF